MTNDWILDVLADLQAVAEKNNCYKFVRALLIPSVKGIGGLFLFQTYWGFHSKISSLNSQFKSLFSHLFQLGNNRQNPPLI